MMYEFVVLTERQIVRTNRKRMKLWHVGNEAANARSWSVHWMLGKGQALSAAQRASTIALLDALRADGHIDRQAVYGHNEWPRTEGRCAAVGDLPAARWASRSALGRSCISSSPTIGRAGYEYWQLQLLRRPWRLLPGQ